MVLFFITHFNLEEMSSFANIEQVSKAVAEAKEGEYNFDLQLWPDIIKNYQAKCICIPYPESHKHMRLAPSYDRDIHAVFPLFASNRQNTFTDKYSLTRGDPVYQKKMIDFCIEKQLTVTPMMIHVQGDSYYCDNCKPALNTDIGVIFHWK